MERSADAELGARSPARLFVIGAAAFLAGLVPFLVRVRAWPEIAAPAYFVSRGGLLYDSIFFPHTPLLISTMAGLGALFGFSAFLFRAMLAVGLAATAALVAGGLERERGFAVAAAASVGLAVTLLWEAYLGGFAVWPDVLMAPLVLGAALLLERHEVAPSRRRWIAAGLCLGIAILVKQTSAWVALGAMAWAISRRKRPAEIAGLAAAIALPYAAFAVLWAAAFRTSAHVYWTLVVPLFSSHAAEIRTTSGLWSDAHEALAPFLVVPAVLLLERAAARRRPSPMPWMIVATAGMAWPRGDLLHLTAAVGLIAFLTARCVLLVIAAVRRWHAGALRVGALAAGTGGAALLVIALGVAGVGGGAQLADEWGGEVFYWDDPLTDILSAEVAAKAPPGSAVFLYNTNRDNLYARTGTTTPGGLYVNSSFWFYFNKRGVGERVTNALRDFRGWVLFREPAPDDKPLRDTELHRFLAEHAVRESNASDDMTWRRLRP